MIYRFILDNVDSPNRNVVLVEQPLGWDEMKIRITRDKVLKGVFENLDATLTFTADGYDYLKNVYDNSNYCAETKIYIQRSTDDEQNFKQWQKGILFVSDMEFNEFQCSAKVVFTDDSFFGRINNRRSTQAYLTGDKTINGEDLTPATVYPMKLFNPATGADLALVQPYGIYRVFDVLSYLVSYMTDNEVEFASPYFDFGGDFAQLGLTYGYPIRATGNSVSVTDTDFARFIPAIDFETFFKELDHRFNLGMYIDETGSKPKLVIDLWQELYTQTVGPTFPDLPNLKTKISKQDIYSRVRFAGADTFDAPAASFPEGIRFIGFAKEEYAITGKCNVDTVLDLSYDFISSSNVIEEIAVLSGTDDTWDKDWFLIDCTVSPGQLNAKKSNWITPGATEQYYNERLTNYEISKRFFGFIPNSIAAYLGSNDNSFRAEKTTFQRPVFGGTEPNGRNRILFQDDFTAPNRDPLGNYNAATAQYDCPNSGVYAFDVFIRQFQTPLMGIVYGVSYYLERYDNGGTLISETLLGVLSTQFGLVTGQFKATIQLAATDYVIVTFIENASFDNVAVEAQSTFAGVATADGGGIYQTYEPADYPIVVSEFTTEITESQVTAIRAAKLGKVNYYISALDPRTGWIDDVTIDEFKGTINAKILRSRTEEPKLPVPNISFVTIAGQLPDSPFTLTPSDVYGRPFTGSDAITKVFFFNAGDEVTIAIPSTYLGCPLNPTVSINIAEYKADGSAPINTPTTLDTATFTVNLGSNYIITLNYNVNQLGNTFPTVYAQVIPPDNLGDNGTASILCVSPSNPADYTFLWSTGDTTPSISKPAGSYSCLVTNTNPGTYDTNAITFNIEIPISKTGA